MELENHPLATPILMTFQQDSPMNKNAGEESLGSSMVSNSTISKGRIDTMCIPVWCAEKKQHPSRGISAKES